MVNADFARAVREADPDRYFTVLLAPRAARDTLLSLYLLDIELARSAVAASEPMLCLIRIAWWRERVEGLPGSAHDGPPLLAALAALVAAGTATPSELAALADGWPPLVETAEDPAALDAHCCARGGALFDLAARILSGGTSPALHQAGHVWARAEARRLLGVPAAPQSVPVLAPLPGLLKPLARLALLASRDLDAAAPPPKGTLARQLLLLASPLPRG